MKIIVAQGNPGSSYAHTRHNIGWQALDVALADSDVTWKEAKKFFAEVAETTVNGEKVLWVKPNTFYNETGRSVRALLDFYKLDLTDLLVIHDELALPFGTLRIRHTGSDAGNNGIKSITAAVGSDFARLRIGISNDLRTTIGDADFVLARFSAEEQQQLPEILKHTTEAIEAFITGSLEAVTKKLEK